MICASVPSSSSASSGQASLRARTVPSSCARRIFARSPGRTSLRLFSIKPIISPIPKMRDDMRAGYMFRVRRVFHRTDNLDRHPRHDDRDRRAAARITVHFGEDQPVIETLSRKPVRCSTLPDHHRVDHEQCFHSGTSPRWLLTSSINCASNCDAPAVSTIMTPNPPFSACRRRASTSSGGLTFKSDSTGTSIRSPSC